MYSASETTEQIAYSTVLEKLLQWSAVPKKEWPEALSNRKAFQKSSYKKYT